MNKTILNIEPIYPIQNTGWLDIKLSKIVMDRLDQYISVANISKKENLVGHVSRSLTLIDKEHWFLKNCLLEIIAEFNQQFPHWTRPILTNSVPYALKGMWVNFQKQQEFNPVHNHAGIFSFVVFVNIPTDWREQHEIPFAKESNTPMASDFQFVYTDMYGKNTQHNYWLDPSYNGRMLFFPAELNHTVYPFYNCAEERITISGNIMFHTGGKYAGHEDLSASV